LWCQNIRKDQQVAFYQGVGNMGGADAGATVEELLVGREDHAETIGDGGDYLPLGVWGQMGYNVDDIANNSEACDKKTHKVLGDTYRVRILSKGNTAVRATGRTTRLGTKRKLEDVVNGAGTKALQAQLALENQGALQAQLALENADPEGSDSSQSSSNSSSRSSSSNSSSSSDHKKSKKSKKNKKSKKSKKSKKNKKDNKDNKSKKDKKSKKSGKASCTSIYLYIYICGASTMHWLCYDVLHLCSESIRRSWVVKRLVALRLSSGL
jgi:hypothetical protein